LEEITSGDIAIGGRVVNQLEPAERDIAMVFQNYALYPHMSVFDNMAYGLKIAKVPADEIRQRVDKAADILQLSPYLAIGQTVLDYLALPAEQYGVKGVPTVRGLQAYLADELELPQNTSG
jgi:sn-glycerol 3-phosphate transport system ATP-binding protein